MIRHSHLGFINFEAFEVATFCGAEMSHYRGTSTRDPREGSASAGVREIQSSEARVRWGEVLDLVAAGSMYVISKRHRAVAALVPFEQWCVAEEGNAEPRELETLVRQLRQRRKMTMATIDEAFAVLACTREELVAMRTARGSAES